MVNDVKDLEELVNSVLPPQCELSKIELEGPQVVLYLKNMHAFYADVNLITRIASKVRKKVLVRSDSSILMPPERAKEKVAGLIPPEAGVKEIRFDPHFNEVLIEAAKPGVVIGKGGSVLKSITLTTGWSPRVLRAPTMPSEIESAIRNALLAGSEQRKKFLGVFGKRMLGAPAATEWVKMTALGGFREVGRSCFLLQTPKSNVIVDCGLNIDTSDATRAYPYLNAMGLSLEQIDAVILSHAHLDHCLHPDSLIQLANGEISSIEDLAEHGGDVVSYDFVSGATAGAVASKGATQKPEMLRIKTNLFSIRATPEHRFFVVNGLDVREKRAGELREGDFVAALRSSKFEGAANQPLPLVKVQELAFISGEGRLKMRQTRESFKLTRKQVAAIAGVPACQYAWLESGRHKPSRENLQKCLQALGLKTQDFGNEVSAIKSAELPKFSSEEFCQFLGYVLGGGNAHYQAHDANCNDLAVTDKDVANLEFYAQLAERVFNTKPRFSLKAGTNGGRNRVFFSSYVTKLMFALDKGIICRSRQRRVPKMIQRASNAELAAFFRGLFDAEGSVGHHSVRLVSSSEMLLRVAQMLLLRLGVQSCIEERKAVSQKAFSKEPFYCLAITHPRSLYAFGEKIGFSSEAKLQKFKAMAATVGNARSEKVDLIPIDGAALRAELADAGLFETDFDSRISRYWNWSHAPSREAVDGICAGIEARLQLLKTASSRQELRITQGQVGKALGVDQSVVSAIERGRISSCSIIDRETQEFLHLSRETCISKAEQLLLKLRMLVSQELAWVKIKSIENETPPEKVYDLSVPGYENFVADGFVVHNSGFIPYLYAYGYEGPVYCTPPTRDMMVLLQQDCVNVMNSEGGKAPYGERDIKKELMHVITREYGEVTDVTSDIRFTFHNAGHMIGSSIVHIHIGEGMHNLIYSGDIKFGRTKLCDTASTQFPRAETLMIEATYGGRNDIKPRIEDCDAKLSEIIRTATGRRGKVLIPVLASGRAQELMLTLEEQFSNPDFTVYMDGMSREASAIHTVYPEYLRRNIQRRILQNDSPFDKPMFKNIQNNDHRKAIAESDEPAVILAPSGMLTGGPSVEFLKLLADDARNSLVFVSYQGALTLGRRLQQGEREVPVLNRANKQDSLKINMAVQSIEGYSGHSDRSQLVAWTRNIRPKPSRIFTMHGEEGKCEELVRTLGKMLHVQTQVPMNLDSIRLK
ncbi:helix-turn-helix domain-containing protein [Candidatus Micrarchaeota archaeon]|nr:helix-turn-helix domain-containing protein [Candidatus Micrarchaeota archaeon]